MRVVKDGALTDLEQTGDPDSTLDNASEPITLNEANPTKKNVDFGYVPDYFITGTIYRDGNRSGALDSYEKLYGGVTVQLRDKDGNVVATTTTDADGTYSFDKLPAAPTPSRSFRMAPSPPSSQTGDPGRHEGQLLRAHHAEQRQPIQDGRQLRLREQQLPVGHRLPR